MFKIIDAHVHTQFESHLSMEMIKLSGVDFSYAGLKKEMQSSNVVAAISMGISDDEKRLRRDVESPIINAVSENIIPVGGINPYKPNLGLTENALRSKKIKGLKIYLGYYLFYPYDKCYIPFYKLAEKYKIPVIFHTGDTYIEESWVKFAHPINIDEIAVKFRNVDFILAHFGNPWMIDAAELLWKNKNVYADLSGLIVGNVKEFKELRGISIANLKQALDYCGFDKLLYGSDWPIVPMKSYIKFIKKIIPKEYQEKVFYSNAQKLFNL